MPAAAHGASPAAGEKRVIGYIVRYWIKFRKQRLGFSFPEKAIGKAAISATLDELGAGG
jgi:hypothetical protein